MFKKKLSRGLVPAILIGASVLLVPGQASAAPKGVTCDWVASYAGAWVPMHRASNSVTCYMARGAHSPAVQKLQHSMNLCYGENLDEDSDFGQLTEAALKRTQSKAGTTADGEYGPNTRKAMKHQPINGGACIRVP